MRMYSLKKNCIRQVILVGAGRNPERCVVVATKY